MTVELGLKNYRSLKKCDLQNLIDMVRGGLNVTIVSMKPQKELV